MRRSLKHVTRLVEDLLDIARIDQGKISLRKERLHLQEVLGFAMEAVRPALEEAEHALHLDVTPEPIWLDADPARITQIINNLVGNAVKYTDNGVGIPAEQQSRIFEIFEQIEGGARAMQDGLGIGLALVRQLVELHDGSIVLARSAVGEGSTFEVRLPATG
jgi:signal transduction histidine kinase